MKSRGQQSTVRYVHYSIKHWEHKSVWKVSSAINWQEVATLQAHISTGLTLSVKHTHTHTYIYI